MPETKVKPEPLPMKEAISFWKDKVPLASKEFAALSDELKIHAFIVSGIKDLDILQDLNKSIQKALEDGVSLKAWKKEFKDLWEKKGWTGKKAWRVDNIFRTNVQTAYATGRYKQMKEVTLLRPYWKYSAIGDRRTRPTHAALHGKVFRHDNPFWNTWYPPNGFG